MDLYEKIIIELKDQEGKTLSISRGNYVPNGKEAKKTIRNFKMKDIKSLLIPKEEIHHVIVERLQPKQKFIGITAKDYYIDIIIFD